MPCALCTADSPLTSEPVPGGPEAAAVEVCETCKTQINGTPEPNHWRCLSASMWSEDPATQVMAARMLARLADQGWARDLADQLYLDDETRAWAENVEVTLVHKDANGAVLAQGIPWC